MRIVFAGTPEFAAQALRRIVEARFEVALVLTQPDRPAGRGLKLQASAVKRFAEEQGIAVAQPRSLRLDASSATTRAPRKQPLSMRAPTRWSSRPTG